MPRTYGGIDAAARRATRRARLLDASLDLLLDGGLQALTVRGVCERGRVGPRFFYESFADTDELLVALYDCVVTELIHLALCAVAAAPPETGARVRAILLCAMDFAYADPRKAHLLLSLALATPALTERRFRACDRFFAAVRHASDHRISRRQAMAFRFLVGGCAELLAAWVHDPGVTDRTRILDDCTDFCLRQLLTPMAAAR